jgi:hypothetical protein
MFCSRHRHAQQRHPGGEATTKTFGGQGEMRQGTGTNDKYRTVLGTARGCRWQRERGSDGPPSAGRDLRLSAALFGNGD